MRSKEVDKSIEIFKEWLECNEQGINILLNRDEIIDIQVDILNYISELEKYKRKHSIVKRHYVSKDEIRDKIKELSKGTAYKVGLEDYTIRILNELLEGE